MVVISEKELKKRAEHNYGRLHDLEEVKYVIYVDFEHFANDQIPLQLLHFSKMFSKYNLDKLLQILLFRSPSISFTFKRLKTWTSCAGA